MPASYGGYRKKPAEMNGNLAMSDPAPDRITLKFNMTADDYARHAAVIGRRNRSWLGVTAWAAAGFGAIPVALLFRLQAAGRQLDTEAIEMIGSYSLYAFTLGMLAAIIGSSVAHRIFRRRYFEAMATPREFSTLELYLTGLTVTATGAQYRYEWTRIRQCTRERSLLLMWITPRSAVAIPDRSFGDAAAYDAAFAFVRARLRDANATNAQAQGA